MMKFFASLVLSLSAVSLSAQTIQVEYNKNKDMSAYKTYQMGEAEIITPEDKRLLEEAKTREVVNRSIELELKGRGLQRVDSAGQLVVSYIIGSMQRSSVFDAGRLGSNTPPAVMQDYSEGNFIIDLNDRSGNLIWRVNAVTTFTTSNLEAQIDQVLSKGFKKFPNIPKTKKKK